MLNIFVSLALYDFFLNLSLPDLKIKWPNDLMTSGKKLAGILIENYLRQDKIGHSVVGIGVNVNQDKFDLPTATSVKLTSGKTYDLNQLLNLLLKQLEIQYLRLKNGQYDAMRNEYTRRLYWIGEKHLFNSTADFEGVIEGIDEYGRLEVETSVGRRAYDMKEIQFIR